MKTLAHPLLFGTLQQYIDTITQEFDHIPAERKALLQKLTDYIQAKVQAREPVQLTFICTHNSRRSHLSQLWAQVAAYYYGIPQVQTYSGGTEATAFNPRAVKAVEKAGFQVKKTGDDSNPVYQVSYSTEQFPINTFSKVYDQGGNPTTNFGAVMTCTHAEDNCPFIPGATRLSLPFDDPKEFDGTSQEEAKYDERTRQIGREIFYAFSLVK
ncbi:MAG: protein-tyrosine-phosphatase [Bacteroidota bacterium]